MPVAWFEKDIPIWQNKRFTKIGTAYGYFDIQDGRVQFSRRFIDALAKESNLALAQLDPNYPFKESVPALGLTGFDEIWSKTLPESSRVDEIWENLRHKALIRGLKRPVTNFNESDYDFFNRKMMEPLVNYLLGLAARAQLVTLDSKRVELDQGIVDAAIGLAIDAKTVTEANAVVVISLGRAIATRIAMRAPDLTDVTALLVLHFYWLMKLGPNLQALEIAINARDRRH